MFFMPELHLLCYIRQNPETLIKNFSVVDQGIMHGAYDNKEVIKTYLPQQERGK
jgi:hypothetical protein